ncbi:MAG: efflux RND transporter periplasmic adaptor subunit, partial [Planctomycetota bacterium]
HGDAAPTQNEIIQLLSQLYNSNLLSADAAPETDQLLRRGRERFKKKAAQQAIGIMYFRMKLFNPDGILSWMLPIFKPMLSLWGLAIWIAVVLFAVVRLLPEWTALTEGFGSTVAPSNWPWLIVVFIVTKAIHEAGHGLICKRFGGQVPEFGVMLLVLFPAPFVDASSAWTFDNKWKRIAVGAGGMLFELFIAAIAAIVWLNTQDGSLIKQIAYNAMFTASLSTVLFNANPLMRFDGYYMLSDFLEVPNLMQRSMNLQKFFFKRYAFGMENETPPSSQRSEQIILLVYGLAAMAYRVFLFISITLYVMTKLFAIGLVLAVWTGVMWFVLPIGKLIHWLASHASLAEHRSRAIAMTILMVIAGVGALGLIPFEDHRRAVGVVQSERDTDVFFRVDGLVTDVRVRPGDVVREGDVLVVSRSPERESELATALAEFNEARSVERRALVENPAAATVARERLQVLIAEIRHHQGKLEELVITAPHDGVVVGADPHAMMGRYVRAGEPATRVVDTSDLRIAAALSQTEAAWHFDIGADRYDVELRLLSQPEVAYRGGNVRVVEAGQARLPHESMGFAGGGQIETRADDQSGRLAKQAQFIMYLKPNFDDVADTDADAKAEGVGVGADEGERVALPWLGRPGEGVRLRFTLPRKPLLHQWADRLHKMVQGKVVL